MPGTPVEGQWYPEKALDPALIVTLISRFCKLYGIERGIWDQRSDKEQGHIILTWAEPGLRLGLIVVLSRFQYTVSIGRDMRLSQGSIRPILRLNSENCYRVKCCDFAHYLDLLTKYRRLKKTTPRKTPPAQPRAIRTKPSYQSDEQTLWDGDE